MYSNFFSHILLAPATTFCCQQTRYLALGKLAGIKPSEGQMNPVSTDSKAPRTIRGAQVHSFHLRPGIADPNDHRRRRLGHAHQITNALSKESGALFFFQKPLVIW